MRDLYYKLGIGRGASTEEVAAALDADPKMSAYAPILLNPRRRAAYDRAHATLSAVGELRHQLGLNSDINWFLEKYPEFGIRRRTLASDRTVQSVAEEPAQAENPETAVLQVDTPRTPPRSRWIMPVFSALVLLILLVLVFMFF